MVERSICSLEQSKIVITSVGECLDGIDGSKVCCPLQVSSESMKMQATDTWMLRLKTCSAARRGHIDERLSSRSTTTPYMATSAQ
jgi:hypothetical protein